MTEPVKRLGWREWVGLPGLALPRMKAKVDTGARTSCLHAFALETFQRDGSEWVRFSVHPKQGDAEKVVKCEAPVADHRPVTDSGGHTEDRVVIRTTIQIGGWVDEIEMTLTARDSMRFRILLGRTTVVAGGFCVDPSVSYQQGKKRKP